MIRAGLILLAVALMAIAAFALAGQPGQASVQWLGWRLDMTAAAAVLLVIFGALIATAVWRTLLWLIEHPARAERRRLDARRRQGAEALTRGFLAAAAGDGAEARRLAQRASELEPDSPALVRVLTAQAAEAADDPEAAKAAYTAMLGFPEMKLAAHRGLMQLALARGDEAEALSQAKAAFQLGRTARWAWRAVLDARLKGGDWKGALVLVDTALERKIVAPVVADRARAALLTASAASLEPSADARLRQTAQEDALLAVKARPDFAPAVVLAARLLAAEGKAGKAVPLIETAWKAVPHPALWRAYRDLRNTETPAERARRLVALAEMKPGARESRILMVEQALMLRDGAEARRLAAGLLEEGEPSARVCALMARVANMAGAPDEARAFMVRAAAAPVEPDWSDIDPDGRAFTFSTADWARLAAAYAETGELIHPRLERRERALNELPELPVSYQVSQPFLAAAGAGEARAPAPDWPGIDMMLDEPNDPAPPPASKRPPRKKPQRLAREGGPGK